MIIKLTNISDNRTCFYCYEMADCLISTDDASEAHVFKEDNKEEPSIEEVVEYIIDNYDFDAQIIN